MQPLQFELLRERLLRAGMAPRHVRRYLRELKDHYDDAILAELGKGVGRAVAEESAARRLGEPDHLVESALARPELLSWSRRWPWAVYVAAPLILFAAAFVATILAMTGVMRLVMSGTVGTFPAPLREVLESIRLFGLYVLRVIAASGFALLATRRGVSRPWGLAAITLVTFVGALPNLDVGADWVGAGIGFATRLDFLVEMSLQRWLPTAVAAVILYMAAAAAPSLKRPRQM